MTVIPRSLMDRFMMKNSAGFSDDFLQQATDSSMLLASRDRMPAAGGKGASRPRGRERMSISCQAGTWLTTLWVGLPGSLGNLWVRLPGSLDCLWEVLAGYLSGVDWVFGQSVGGDNWTFG